MFVVIYIKFDVQFDLNRIFNISSTNIIRGGIRFEDQFIMQFNITNPEKILFTSKFSLDAKMNGTKT